MKKIISFILLALFLIMPLQSMAAGNGVTFFDFADNVGKLGSYRSEHSLYGDITVNDTEGKVEGSYRLFFSGSTQNKKAYMSDSDMDVRGYLKLKIAGKSKEKPFDELTAQINGRVVSVFGDGLYVMLKGVSVETEGIKKEDKKDLEKGLAEAEKYKNHWFKIPLADLTQNATAQLGDEKYAKLADPETISKEFAQFGIKGGLNKLYKDLLKQMKKDGQMTDEDYKKAVKVLDTIFAVTLFTEKTNEKGKTEFQLDKGAILKLVEKLGKIISQEIGKKEMNELRAMMTKFDISGSYQTNEKHGIYDQFLLQLKLWNIEELEKLTVNYRFKMSDIGTASTVKAPQDYTDISETDIPSF